MVDSPQPRPGRRIARIGFHTSQVQIARRAPLFGIVVELIAAQIVLVCLRAGRDILPQDALFARRKRQGERVDHTLSEFVLQSKHIADRGLSGVRPYQGPVRRVSELRGDADFIARGKQRAGDDQVDVGLGCDGFEVLCSGRKS